MSLVVAGSFLLFETSHQSNSSEVVRNHHLPAVSIPVVAELRVSNGKRSEGPSLITARRDSLLKLTVVSDTEDELHVHGYDRHVHLPAGVAATTELVLDKAGRFEVELHKAHTTLTVIEVQPR